MGAQAGRTEDNGDNIVVEKWTGPRLHIIVCAHITRGESNGYEGLTGIVLMP